MALDSMAALMTEEEETRVARVTLELHAYLTDVRFSLILRGWKGEPLDVHEVAPDLDAEMETFLEVAMPFLREVAARIRRRDDTEHGTGLCDQFRGWSSAYPDVPGVLRDATFVWRAGNVMKGVRDAGVDPQVLAAHFHTKYSGPVISQ